MGGKRRIRGESKDEEMGFEVLNAMAFSRPIDLTWTACVCFEGELRKIYIYITSPNSGQHVTAG